MRQGKIAKNTVLSPRHLDKLIEEAIVDCYNEEEQGTGFFTMIEENLAFPFATRPRKHRTQLDDSPIQPRKRTCRAL